MESMSSRLSKFKSLWVLLIIGLFWLTACVKDEEGVSSEGPTPMELDVPAFFPKPILNPDNPLTVEGVNLGKRLYSDAILSSNGLSCASCHHQEKSFSTPLFTDQHGNNISVPPHVNLAFNPNYNWNGNQPILDTLCMADFEPEFFDTHKDTLYRRLSTHSEYPQMFRSAFGIKDFYQLEYYDLKKTICYAISQYMRTLISADSKFDRYIAKKESLTEKERVGMSIFFSEKGDCFHCHGAPLFTDNLFHNNGLSSEFNGLDQGRYLVTGNSRHRGQFSSPTLRNIAFTAPYMHDGRFQTLAEVVEFYNSGVRESATLDPIMTKEGKETGLNLTPYEKECLIAFLHTLSDLNFINQP